MVGVPAAADVGLLVRLLAHLGDHRIAVDRFEEAVDVDRAPALGEGDVLLGRDVLVAEEDDAIAVEGVAHFDKLFVAQAPSEIDTVDLGTQRRRGLPYVDGLV